MRTNAVGTGRGGSRFRAAAGGHRQDMDTTSLTSLFRSPGPFATVVTDVGHDSENGAHEHELRVRAACDELREQGAEASVIEAVAERLGELVDQPSPVGRVVVATPADIAYDELARVQVDRPVATWGTLPDLATWIAHRDAATSFVLAVVGHEGGEVAVYDSDLSEPEQQTTEGGATENVHQVGADDWGALKYQHRTENVWAHNADDVAERIASHVRAGHRLVLLAGDPKSKALVHERLDDSQATVVQLDTGSRGDDGGDEALDRAVRRVLLDQAVERRVARVHELRERLGRGEAVATGVRDVADAFVRGQVDTLLLDPDPASELELDLSDHPGLALGEVASDGPVRADQALVAAAVLTDAEVGVLPSGTMGGAPVAALLRWNQPPT